jgi:heparan sulfate N-deacetylase/N-sulfotransferase NDST2
MKFTKYKYLNKQQGPTINLSTYSHFHFLLKFKLSLTNIYFILQDKGETDGIRRVLFGAGLKFWLHRLLLIDALSYASRGRLSVSLKRYILIDVDDIFVGERGTRLKKSDVEVSTYCLHNKKVSAKKTMQKFEQRLKIFIQAILTAQEELRRVVPGFKFNLGFSGKYFHFGDSEENAGDDLILENSDKFMWFGHMWNHIQPHLYSNVTQLMMDMMKNKDFAKVCTYLQYLEM